MRLKLRGSLARVTIKVCVFAAVCVVLLAILAKEVGNLSFFSHRVSYKADMPDVIGLFPTDDVKVAGVKVGQVSSVSTDHGHAVVTFSVDKNVPLRSSTQVGLRYRNVLGEKYLYVYPGSTGSIMRSGSRIPLNQAISDADIDAFLNALGPFIKAINPQEGNLFVQAMVGALEGNQDQVTQLLGNTATVSNTLGNLNQQVGGVIDNFNTILTAMAQRSGDLDALIKNLNAVSQSLVARNNDLDTAVVEFSQLAAQFKNLLSTNRGNIDQAVNNLQGIADVLSQHHADLEKDLATLPQGLQGYSNIASYGQWFAVRVIYGCLANEGGPGTPSNCSYENPTNQNPSQPSSASSVSPSSGGSARAPAAPAAGGPSVSNITGFASSGRAG
ncbi:MAG TPA: MCE family protein [Acidimicrobiales bacterium]|jgi:phospholipid/cholesterol/gamma-HCH transport system substrate-binding protein|nr:MCE family protein [Acidimicrobiales bacterium]